MKRTAAAYRSSFSVTGLSKAVLFAAFAPPMAVALSFGVVGVWWLDRKGARTKPANLLKDRSVAVSARKRAVHRPEPIRSEALTIPSVAARPRFLEDIVAFQKMPFVFPAHVGKSAFPSLGHQKHI